MKNDHSVVSKQKCINYIEMPIKNIKVIQRNQQKYIAYIEKNYQQKYIENNYIEKKTIYSIDYLENTNKKCIIYIFLFGFTIFRIWYVWNYKEILVYTSKHQKQKEIKHKWIDN